MQKSRLKATGTTFLAALLAVPVLGAVSSQRAIAPQPGVVNYVEGQVSVDRQPVAAESVGSVVLGPGQSLETGNGRSEVLLTPGVVLRVANDSSVTMISPDLLNTEVRLNRGRAMVEVAEIHKENNLLVEQPGAQARLVKTGLYDFDANTGQVRVFDGEAMVRMNGREIKVKEDRQVSLNGLDKAQKFDKDANKDAFYQWASLRSKYLSEANAEVAQSYYNSGNTFLGSGWYWDPWIGSYTFIPGAGSFYSPFGWGFYSPGWFYGAPFYYYGHGIHNPRYHSGGLPRIHQNSGGFFRGRVGTGNGALLHAPRPGTGFRGRGRR